MGWKWGVWQVSSIWPSYYGAELVLPLNSYSHNLCVKLVQIIGLSLWMVPAIC